MLLQERRPYSSDCSNDGCTSGSSCILIRQRRPQPVSINPHPQPYTTHPAPLPPCASHTSHCGTCPKQYLISTYTLVLHTFATPTPLKPFLHLSISRGHLQFECLQPRGGGSSWQQPMTNPSFSQASIKLEHFFISILKSVTGGGGPSLDIPPDVLSQHYTL